MTNELVAGVMVAWTFVLVLLGLYFVLASRFGLREPEHRVFGLLCLALALASAGGALMHLHSGESTAVRGLQLSHAGAIVGATLNLHFVVLFARASAPRRLLATLYVVAAVYELLTVSGLWGSPTVRPPPAAMSSWIPLPIAQAPVEVSPITWPLYALGLVQLLGATGLLGRAALAGQRHVLPAFAGGVVVSAAALIDVVSLLRIAEAPFLLPHGFALYAFAVTGSLLVRYTETRGALAQTTERLRAKTEELRHSYAELRAVQDELVRKRQLAAVGELAAAIAHEVRNPLAVIMNAVSTLRRPGLASDDRGMLLGIVDEEAARLNRLVTDLLRFARPVTVTASVISLPELVSRAGTLVKGDYGVAFETDEREPLELVRADANLLRLMLDALIENACQAMPEGGVVRVRSSRAERDGARRLRIEVIDDGHGMDAAVLQRARDPFFTTRPSGTGLGLPIVDRMMEAHGGSLSLVSDPGAGTRAILEFPWPNVQASEEPAPSETRLRSAS
ncbi:MAG: hypothetical protein IT376_07365 [Polyangiaceae bacterium]|nr:hypothetical protein [Polyangiaceae bacterium]